MVVLDLAVGKVVHDGVREVAGREGREHAAGKGVRDGVREAVGIAGRGHEVGRGARRRGRVPRTWERG